MKFLKWYITYRDYKSEFMVERERFLEFIAMHKQVEGSFNVRFNRIKECCKKLTINKYDAEIVTKILYFCERISGA